MYNSATLKTELIGLVGWKQNIDPSGIQLNDLTTSLSGFYYNDEHPLLTIDNLWSVAPDYVKITFTAWNAGTTYVIGDIAESGGTNYKCILGHTNQTPPDATYWAVYSPFTEWLQAKTEAGIIAAVDMWLSKKFKRRTAANLLTRKNLFDTTGRYLNYEENESKVVGFEIAPKWSKGLKIEIQKIGIWLETDQSVDIKLFSANTVAPLQTETVVYTGNGGLQWVEVNWEIDSTAAYYVVYDQKAVTDRAPNTVQDYTYSSRGMTFFPSEKFYTARAFSFTGGTAALWDIADNVYTTSTNYGLNLQMNVRCDYTDLIIEQKTLFTELIRKKVAIDLLWQIIHNPNSRVTRNERTVIKEQLLFEIEGDPQGRPTGLANDLKNAIDKVSFDLSNVDNVCLPCAKRSVNYTST